MNERFAKIKTDLTRFGQVAQKNKKLHMVYR